MTTTGPLAGIRVLELGTLIAGPFCSRMLAEFGADVIKIESPEGGDPLRQWRVLKDGTSLWWSVQARNKQSLTLNMKTEQGRQIARELALQADIIIENYRPGVLEKWGLGYEELRALNPALIMVRLRRPDLPRPFRSPLYPLAPIVYLLVALYVLVGNLVAMDLARVGQAAAVISAGCVAFVPLSPPLRALP